MGLGLEVLPDLHLRDPFMIASSHWTANISALKSLAPYSPSAVTLKTTSQEHGGRGNSLENRKKMGLVDGYGNCFAYYTDGPKTLELINTGTTYKLLKNARNILPDTLLGLSVLQNEDYPEIEKRIDKGDYDYCELNLKYSFRGLNFREIESNWKILIDDINSFCQTFEGRPIFIKLPREVTTLLPYLDFIPITQILNQFGSGLIVANSKRIRVPPSKRHKCGKELTEGVVVGEYLFMDTYDTIRDIWEKHQDPPISIAASGGVIDVSNVIDSLAAGASAVQLCSILDLRGPAIIDLLRHQISQITNGEDLAGSIANIRDNEDAWVGISQVAKEHSANYDNAADFISEGSNEIFDLIESLIQEELSIEIGEIDGNTEIDTEDNIFVLTYGNISTFLLSRHCALRLRMQISDLKSGGEFIKRIGNPGYKWDFALLPESTILSVEKEGSDKLNNKRPVRILEIGTSITELVGIDGLELTDIQKVFSFGGNSSNTAFEHLLEKCHPEPEKIPGKYLVPLLKCWDQGNAILSKPPLSRFYGMLLPKELHSNWSSLWSHKEKIYLAASEHIYTLDNHEVLINKVSKAVYESRKEIHNDIRGSARRARFEGFLSLCSGLINGSLRFKA